MRTYSPILMLIAACLTGALGSGGCGGGYSSGGGTNAPAGYNVMKKAAGTWYGALDGGAAFTLDLVETEGALSGTFARTDGSGTGPATGQIIGNTMELTVHESGDVVAQWRGTLGTEQTTASGSYQDLSNDRSGTFAMNK